MNRPPPAKSFDSKYLVGFFLLLVLALNFIIRWRLRDFPLERDEGEYAYAGQLLLQGIPPYELAWNMKFPGTYFAYAVLLAIFGQTAAGIHIGIILVTSLSTVLMFLIGCKLLEPAGGLLTAFFFVILSALPSAFGLAGHATHFVVLFVCAGTLVILSGGEKKSRAWILVSGAAFGAAILMKQHAFVFPIAAIGYLLWLKLPRMFIPFTAGILLPLVATAIVLASAGAWHNFVFWTFQYARQYVSIFPLSAVPAQFLDGFGPVFGCGIWIWLLGLIGLGLVFLRGAPRRALLIGGGLFLAGSAATIPGFYFRGHYFLMVMPGLALLVASLLRTIAENPPVRWRRFLCFGLFCLVTGDILIRNMHFWFALSPSEACRSLYGTSPFPESPEIARHISAHTAPTDTIAVLGSEPQIFFLAHRHSASGYIYFYPLTEPQPYADSMRAEFKQQVESARPEYVVDVNVLSSWCSVNMPGETRKIIDDMDRWRDGLLQDYQLAGAEDVTDDGQMQFYWDADLANRTNTAPPTISIYRHK